MGWLPGVLVGLAVILAALGLAGVGVGRWGLKISGTGERTAGKAIMPSKLISRIELPLLILIAPMMLFSATLGVVGIGVILLLWVGRRITRGYFLPKTPLDWPLAVMCVMIPVGMLVSPDLGWSVGRAEVILYGVALFYGIVDWAVSQERLEMVTLAFLLGGAAIAGLSLMGTAWQYKVPVIGDIAQMFPQVAQGLSRNSTGFHPNIVAGALLFVVLPLAAMLIDAWQSRPRTANGERWYQAALGNRWLLAVLLLVTGGTLVLTQSRGALVAAVAGLAIMMWLLGPRMKKMAVGVGIVGVVLVSIMLLGWWKAESAVPTPQSGLYDENVVVRFDVWRSALKGIEEYPATGIGLDAFHKLLPTRYPAPSVPDEYDIGHAHNQLLQAALDLGLPGLVGFLAVWAAAGAMSLAIRSAGFAAALAAAFVHGLVDTVVLVSKPGVLFWAMLGLLAAKWRLTRIKGESTLQE